MPFDDEFGCRVRVGHPEARPPVAAHGERDTRSGTVAVVGGAASLVHTERRRPRTSVKNKYQRFPANKALLSLATGGRISTCLIESVGATCSTPTLGLV